MKENYSALTFGMQMKQRTNTDPLESLYKFSKIILLPLIYLGLQYDQNISEMTESSYNIVLGKGTAEQEPTIMRNKCSLENYL
jgi:hypothetical protein